MRRNAGPPSRLRPQSGHDPALGLARGIGKAGVAMQTVMDGYRGLSLLVWLNADRLFTLGTVVVGLLAGAFLGSAITQP